jgi:hypothetical protein
VQYRSDSEQTPLEIAILVEEIKTYIISSPYPKGFIEGKFNIPVLSPTMKFGEKESITSKGIKVRTQNNVNTKTNVMSKDNYVTLQIPSYMCLDFVSPYENDTYILDIPEGTKFLVGFINEDCNRIRILGLEP